MKDMFSGCHPIINFAFFTIVMLFTMCFLQPYYLGISFFAAFAYSIYLNGMRGLKFNFLIALPMLILATVLNPLFNHEGMTILTYFWNGNPLTLESILYGLASAVMFIGVILWFSCYNAIMTSDKFIYLFGRIIPAISLVFSMVLRFVPSFKAQLKIISNGQKCIGRDLHQGTRRQRIHNGFRILSILVTWALENGIETADSMRSRGYGLAGRTSYSFFRFDTRDKVLTVTLLLMLVIVFLPVVTGDVFIYYYPMVQMNDATLWAVLDYLVFSFLCFLPLLLDVVEDVKWHVLKSKI
ncbi:MAG TPA: energy-coupling factor transporter transmembrane component T [Clostridiales bacterium]|nr:energy-coupling factor transporter transmembrane component T [Clostridiales bacterium]